MLPTNHQRCSPPAAMTVLFACALGLMCGENSTRAGDAAPASRPCVLLTNDNVLYGVAKQQGEWVLVRNGDDNESRLPRQSVACWAESIRDLYQFRVDRRRPGNLQDLINDARWCMDNDLVNEAATLVPEIQTIDPASTQARFLANQIRHRTLPPGTPTATIPSIQTSSHTESVDFVESEIAAIGLRELRSFASQIQPLLSNRCGVCHSDPSDRDWSLLLPAHGMRPSSRMTRENVKRSVAFLNAESPDQSPLLLKALSPHGGSDAPLDPSDSRAIESLRYWIGQTASKVLVDRESGLPNQALPSLVLNSILEFESTTSPTDPELGTPTTTAARMMPSPHSPAPQVARLPQVANPFDPEIFNRKFHPPQPPPNSP